MTRKKRIGSLYAIQKVRVEKVGKENKISHEEFRNRASEAGQNVLTRESSGFAQFGTSSIQSADQNSSKVRTDNPNQLDSCRTIVLHFFFNFLEKFIW